MAKKQKKRKEKSSPAMKVLKFLATAFAVLLIFAFIDGRMQVSRMEQELAAATQEVEQQQENNEELKNLMNTGDEAAYIERVARERLGYVRPGERIFIDITGD